MWWLGLCALALGLLGLLSYYLPVSVGSNLQARAEPSGNWALAFGIAIGPVAFSAIWAHGVPPFMTCHLFGRQLLRLPLSRWLRARKKSADAAVREPRDKALNLTRIERAIGRFFSGLDPLEALWSWREKKRVFEVRSLELDVAYSFRDVALTGQILAGLCMLSGVLPERYVIKQTPGWESEDRLTLAADGRFRIWPVRLVVDVLGFVLKQRSMARRSAVPASE
ncbi:MAG TPA: hypothetical protein VFK05_21860 [Polyangiaceae bacterium]|nr:hypothetical protein [Polyangiaceae bacterium]